MIRRTVLMLLLFLFLPYMAGAVNPDEILDNSELEGRARAISKQVRCVVCQNESIDDSNAGLARDLRLVVRGRLLQGDSDEEVYSFLTDRYGSFILLMPPLRWSTVLLWGGPLLFFVMGSGFVVFYYRRCKKSGQDGSAPLSDEEQERLRHLLRDDPRS